MVCMGMVHVLKVLDPMYVWIMVSCLEDLVQKDVERMDVIAVEGNCPLQKSLLYLHKSLLYLQSEYFHLLHHQKCSYSVNLGLCVV